MIRFINETHTIINVVSESGIIRVVEPDMPEWESLASVAAPYVPPPEPTAEELLERIRATAFLPKDDFILSALDLGILSEADAEQATNGWPAGWDDFFKGKPARERIKAMARWANAANVYRNAPLIEALADFKDLSPEQVDALFGVEA